MSRTTTIKTGARAPGEGERQAMRGYTRQYGQAAVLIYVGLQRGGIEWIGVADREAGIADDIVLGFPDHVSGHQFKTASLPGRFTLRTLLMGVNGLLEPLVAAWRQLCASSGGKAVEVCLVTNQDASTEDRLTSEERSDSASFLIEFTAVPPLRIAQWRATRWSPFIEELQAKTELNDTDFERFITALKIAYGPAADFERVHRLRNDEIRQVAQIAQLLPRLVADARDRDRWSRSEFLHELGWQDTAALRRPHHFPVGAYVQRNEETEAQLRHGIEQHSSGYLSLIGPPGAGKSTLLQIAVESVKQLFVVRYLAYIPNAVQGVGRGEAEDFLDDISVQLRKTGLIGLRPHDDSLAQRREQFFALLTAAGDRFRQDGIRTLIIVDGLDHVPREERPTRSFLRELPLPVAVPEGVLFLLGTQRVDLEDLPPAVQDQATLPARQIHVAPLPPHAVARMADMIGLAPEIDRMRVYQNSRGHPLVSRYLIEALGTADTQLREELLDGALSFQGDLATVYQAAWRAVNNDEDSRMVLDYLARTEAPMPFNLLVRKVPEAAIERALKATRHLLSDGRHGWTVFHNSFRLFIREQPKLRFGHADRDYSTRLYNDLATLAREADTASPQRWLELRYLARANAHDAVLDLSTSERFRQHFIERRPFSEMRADLRLAMMSARFSDNHVKLFQLMLIFDEMDRRWSAYEEAPEVVDALLAVDDIDGAATMVEQVPGHGYAVIDALIGAEQRDRARAIFDDLDPLQDLLREHRYSGAMQFEELRDWARHVIHFRAPDQILTAIDRLVLAARDVHDEPNADEEAAFSAALKKEAVLAILEKQEGIHIDVICAQFEISVAEHPSVLLRACVNAFTRGNAPLAMAYIRSAMKSNYFHDTPNGERRRAGLLAARHGARELAEQIYRKLEAPTLAPLDGSTEFDAPRYLARAILEHFELAALLDITVPEVPRPKSAMLRPLQFHAEAIANLLGRVRRAADDSYEEEIGRAARAALVYLTRITPQRGGDFYALHQAVQAAPPLIAALIEAAALAGQPTLDAVGAIVEQYLMAGPTFGEMRDCLLRTATIAIYRHTQDSAVAARRIGALEASLHGQTPAQQIGSMATLACAFSETGNRAQAHALLKRMPNESLGFSLPPKKDPQYAIWRDLLSLANRSDPDGRAGRLNVMLRVLSGMTDTEGDASAVRIAATLVQEAALCDAVTAWKSFLFVADIQSLGWAHLIDAVVQGLVRRRPDMVPAAVLVWCQLALPFYKEPYYRESARGEFVDAAMTSVEASDLERVCSVLLKNIQVGARADVRVALLDHLSRAAKMRGCQCADIDAALARWRIECPPPSHTSSDMRHSDVTSMEDLATAIDQEAGEGRAAPGYEASHAFARLVNVQSYSCAAELFEKWPQIQEDSRARAALIDIAIEAGDKPYAQQLFDGYSFTGPDATWSTWSGGKRYRYFRSKLRLEGDSVHGVAYADFVQTVSAEHESVRNLLMEFEHIFPILTAKPDWPAMWKCVQEQIMATREFSLGAGVPSTPQPVDDAGLLARLLVWAIDIGLADLRGHVYIAAAELNKIASGRPVFEEAIRVLQAGVDDHPAIGMHLLASQPGSADLSRYDEQIVKLINHGDYAVAALAIRLARRLALPVSRTRIDLPQFYSLDLDEVEASEPESLYDQHSGAMTVDAPFGWTRAYQDIVQTIARNGVSATHIRYRAAMLINRWGGLAMFGNQATQALESRLRALDLKTTYTRPHMVVAARALRMVAGELAQASTLVAPPNILLHHMDFAPNPFVCKAPSIRPAFVARPDDHERSWAALDKTWLPSVDEDLNPLSRTDGVVVAEVYEFNVRKSRREYKSIRVRVPDSTTPSTLQSWEVEDLLPERAVWLDQPVALSNQPASCLVRRLSLGYSPGIPHIAFCICPIWLERLNWTPRYGPAIIYTDIHGNQVARIVWWREGGAVDMDEDATWGEGTYLQLSASGLRQFEAIAGKLTVRVHAQRTAHDRENKGAVRQSVAVGIDLL